MDLARDRSAAIIVNAVLSKDFFELDGLLVLRPVLDLPHESGLKVLKASWLLLQLAPHPLDGARLVGHKEAQLPQLRGRIAFAVIFRDLRRKEVHAVALGIALVQPSQKLGSRKRYGKLALNMERDHAVV